MRLKVFLSDGGDDSRRWTFTGFLCAKAGDKALVDPDIDGPGIATTPGCPAIIGRTMVAMMGSRTGMSSDLKREFKFKLFSVRTFSVLVNLHPGNVFTPLCSLDFLSAGEQNA